MLESNDGSANPSTDLTCKVTDQESLDTESTFPYDPMTSMAILNSLRNGQPTPALMQQLSVNCTAAIGYLRSEMLQRRSIVKILIGDPGAGKTTFKTLLAESVADLNYVAPIALSLAASSSFNSRTFFGQALFDVGLMDRAINSLRHADDGAKYLAAAQKMVREKCRSRSANILNAIIGASLKHEHNISALSNAAQIWFSDGLKRPLIQEINKLTDATHITLPDMQASQQDTVNVMYDMIDFYVATGVYPIWLVDEFESHTTMNNGMSGRLKLLSIFREFIDSICASNGSGILILSTRDGHESTAAYPALRNRLRGRKMFSLPQTVWPMDHLTNWDAAHVASTIEQLYQSAAAIDTYICGPVDEALKSIDNAKRNELTRHVQDILSSKLEPRTKLQEVVSNNYDLLSSSLATSALLARIARTKDESCIMSDIYQDPETGLETSFTMQSAPQSYDNTFDETAGIEPEAGEWEQHRLSHASVQLYELLPSGSLIQYSPPGFDTSSDVLPQQIAASLSAGHLHVAAKRLATWRTSKGINDLPEEIKKKLHAAIPKKGLTWGGIQAKLNVFLEHATLCKTEFAVLSRTGVTMIDPLETISILRSFIYQYAIQHGVLPDDSKIDSYILKSLRELYKITPMPARGGIRFNGVKRGLIGAIFSSDEFIADIEVSSKINYAITELN